jgi:hypothetical protein
LKKDFRGRFVIKGKSSVLDIFWNEVKAQTVSGSLGYFADISNDSEVIIVYHANYNNKREKNRIRDKLNELRKGYVVKIVYRNDYDDRTEVIKKNTSRASDSSETETESLNGFIVADNVVEYESSDSEKVIVRKRKKSSNRCKPVHIH